ncbi:MAG: gfo/Idh/MocA family oxidoreductase [Acidobacteria bacterium]|nr:gfo/Idh/MocA family oxidoreductase [Acidobacteriota bacterium]
MPADRREFLASAGLLALTALQPGRAAPPPSDKKIRIGVLGGGFGTQFFWHEHPQCEVAAVTDLRADRRQALRDAYRCDYAFSSYDEMLAKAGDRLDAVAVFSGAPDHVDHACLAMERGLHVISAVPACMSLEDAERLRATKERTGRRYMMAETSYYRGASIYARELHRKQGFGELYCTELEYYHDRGDLNRILTDKTTRHYNPDGSHSWRWGLPPMLYPTHCLGFLVGVTRERIAKVSALGWGQEHPLTTDNAYNNPFWCESALMQTDQGHMSRCNVFWMTPAHGERARWYGEKGSLAMAYGGAHADLWTDRSMTPDRPNDPAPLSIPDYWKSDMLPAAMRHSSGHGGSHTFLAAEFINALLEDREPAVDVYEALAMTVPGIVAHQSALRGGEQLAVPRFDRA